MYGRFGLGVLVSALLAAGCVSGPAKTEASDPPSPAAAEDRQIRHITDRNLFAALDLALPALADVEAAVAVEDYRAAYRAWAEYWQAKEKVAWIERGGVLRPIDDVEAELRSRSRAAGRNRRRAEPLMRHRIRGWGEVTHQHGEVVDFNFDYGRSGKYGFHYWGWSEPLLTAWHATGDTRYLAEFDRLFNQWYEQRDAVEGIRPDRDVIWYELGLGHRSRRFLHYYTCPLPDRSLETHERMLKTLLGAGRWLYDLERRGYRDTNWQVIGSYGLVDIAVRVPEFHEAQAWRDVGVARLMEHLERGFYADGCHRERSPAGYMSNVYRDLNNLALLLQTAGVRDDALRRLVPHLEKPLQWWMLATNPLGHLPALNDTNRREWPEACMRQGAARYDRPGFLYVVEQLKHGAARSRGRPPDDVSVHFAPSGAAVLRSGWSRKDNYLFLNYGTHDGGHSHRATLDFELVGCGGPLALDAGIGESYDDPLHHAWYTTARAHNMLVVDEANVDKAAARGYDVFWHSDGRLDVFGATHDGYRRSHGLVHRRRVAFLKPDAFVVFDACTSDGTGRTLSWYVHSPTDLRVAPGGRVASAAGPGVVLMEAWPDTLRRVRQGKGMCALEPYGPSRPIDWIAYDRPVRRGNDNRFAVAMLPFAGTPPAAEFTGLPSPPGTAVLRLRRGATTDILVFGTGERLEVLQGRLVTDGRFAWIREGPAGRRGTVVAGRTLTWDGRSLAP